MRTVFVTGAGSGLGLALAERWLAAGDTVIAARRSPSPALGELAAGAQGRLVDLALDVTDEPAVSSLPTRLAEHTDRIDVVLNNAGVSDRTVVRARPARPPAAGDPLLAVLDLDSVLTQLRVNLLGPVAIVQSLLGLLRRSAEPVVVNVSSLKASLALTDRGGNYGYAISKAAANMATRILAADLEPHGAIVVAIHPGWVRTRLGGEAAPVDAAAAADGLHAIVAKLSLHDTGRFIGPDGEDIPW
jgi:NAD(P)-dependent dehydrogenase (short-subunit alcohol dehydrogenase family)